MFEKKIYLTISLNLTYCLNKLKYSEYKGFDFLRGFSNVHIVNYMSIKIHWYCFKTSKKLKFCKLTSNRNLSWLIILKRSHNYTSHTSLSEHKNCVFWGRSSVVMNSQEPTVFKLMYTSSLNVLVLKK